MSEVRKGTIKVKAGNKKGFLIVEDPDQWYTANKEVIADLAKVDKGDVVEITYVSKGAFRNVSKIVKVGGEEVKAETKVTGFACEECGAKIDGKYKKCYVCNKKAKDNPKPEVTKTQVIDEPEKKSTWTPGNYNKSNYGSAEDVAGKEVGCAANCASSILTGAGIGTTQIDVMQLWRQYFNDILEHIRLNK